MRELKNEDEDEEIEAKTQRLAFEGFAQTKATEESNIVSKQL